MHVRQSAKQLDVQKNVLLNGFDSSTENQPFFKLPDYKFLIAPFPVKREEIEWRFSAGYSLPT